MCDDRIVKTEFKIKVYRDLMEFSVVPRDEKRIFKSLEYCSTIQSTKDQHWVLKEGPPLCVNLGKKVTVPSEPSGRSLSRLKEE